MSSEDERATATLTAEDEPEQADGAWYFNISDDARRREADLTRDLRRALVDEYRQQDARTKRKRLFGLLPVGSDSAESDTAVPAFLPRPPAQREDSSGPVPERPSMRLAGRAGRRQPEPVEEVAPAEPAWTPRFLRESDGPAADMPPPAPLRQPPTEPFDEDVAFDVTRETSDWFDEPQPAPVTPSRPRELRRVEALYAGEDDWTTSLVPATLTALAATEPGHPPAEAVTPVAEAFMRLAAAEEPGQDITPRPPARPRQRHVDTAAATTPVRTPAEDDWHTEPLAILASWNTLAPVAPGVPAPEPPATAGPDVSLASWFDEAFHQEDEPPTAPANRFAPDAPEAQTTAPASMRRAEPRAWTSPQDDWTTELTLAIASGRFLVEPTPIQEAEPEPEPFGRELRRKTAPAEPAAGGKSRWDEMMESSSGNTGSIVDAMREVWADAATAAEPTPRRRRSLRGLRQEAPQHPEPETIPTAAAEPTLDAAVARTEEPGRLVGKLGGIIRRRRHDEPAEATSGESEAQPPIDAARPEPEAEIPATLWKELFGDPDAASAGREQLPFPAAIEHRPVVLPFADPMPAEDLPVDEDISLDAIFGEATPDTTPQAAAPVSPEAGDLLPPAPVWVDDDADEPAAFEAMAAAQLHPEEEHDEGLAPDAGAPEGWTSEPLGAIAEATGTEAPETPAPASNDAQEAVDAPAPDVTAWGDLGGSALPYDIAWPEPAAEALPETETPAVAEAQVATTTTAPGAEEDDAPSPASDGHEGQVWHPLQPEDGDASQGEGAEPADRLAGEHWDQPVEAAERDTTAVDAVAVAEPDQPHDTVRPGTAYSGFKPIQEVPHEAEDDSWEAFFGVERTDQEDETAG